MSPNTIPAGTIVLALSLCSLAAFAQDSTAPLSSAGVRAETRAAEKNHQLQPMGDEPERQPPARSTTTRAQVKAATRAAEKDHKLLPPGDEPERQAHFVSTTTRAQVKAKTRAAERTHQLPPAGQAE